MDRDLIQHALRPALWGAVAFGAAVYAVTRSPAAAGGFLAGAAWNVANFQLLQALALAWTREQRRRALTLLLAKLLLLYPIGLFLALSGAYSLIAMLLGFTWVFVVLIGVAVRSGRAMRPPLAEAPRG